MEKTTSHAPPAPFASAPSNVSSVPADTPAASALRLDKIFPGSGEMAQRMRAMDWSRTPLGSVETWSPSLRMIVGFLLANRFPLLLWWEPDFCQIYNDPYQPILGSKHPESLGQPASVCWSEIWDVIGPLIETPFSGGPATWSDDLFLEIHRHGFVEETHFTIAYSPVPDDTVPSGIGGVLATVHEISDTVVAERRVMALRDLGARSAEAKTAEEACRIAAEALAQHPEDIPFALLYLLSSDGTRAHLAATTGVARDAALSPSVIELGAESAQGAYDSAGSGDIGTWPLAEVVRGETMQVVECLAARFDAVPPGPWANPPTTAVVVPIRSNTPHQLAGLLVAGVSAHLRLDDTYSGFYDLVSSQIATAIANARAYEAERQRAEALAAIDRAKTAFFSNVSHEFRTPLTLMLGPVEDGLADTAEPLPPGQRARQRLVHRNSLRLLKLVNTLLDFARIEAGRAQAAYVPTDLASYTAELASSFRSLVEQAGMAFVVDCPPLDSVLGEPVYVDREMWEKVVLNLLSNAFKFTFTGSITVSLRAIDDGRRVALTVRDTGTGIAPEELPLLFERFHRVQSARSRSFEGSGIGLALVQELVHLHGGAITVASELGRGTTFTVTLPTGTAHLPAESVRAAHTLVSTAMGAAPYVEEARRWLPESQGTQETALADESASVMPWLRADTTGSRVPQTPSSPHSERARILVADDNADLRDYLRRLLSEQYTVEVVANGAAALAAARARPPALLVADVMMPELDGLGLLSALRADPRTQSVPVILLSARAGDEATIEGLEAGADDYLVKPFSAREVLARVAARLEIAWLRREAVARAHELETAFEAITDGVVVFDCEGHFITANAAFYTIAGRVFGEPNVRDTLAERAAHIQLRDADGHPLSRAEWPQTRILSGETLAAGAEVSVGESEDQRMYFSVTGAPLRAADGTVAGAVLVARDVTSQRLLERSIRESERRLRAILDLLPTGVAVVDDHGRVLMSNQAVKTIWGDDVPFAESRADYGEYKAWWPATGQRVAAHEWGLTRALAHGEVSMLEEIDIESYDGVRKTILNSNAPLRDESGAIVGGMSVFVDVTERKRLERQTQETLAALFEVVRGLVAFPDAITAETPNRATLDRTLVDLAHRIFPVRFVSLFTMTPGTDLLELRAMAGYSPEQEALLRKRNSGLRLSERIPDARQRDRLLAGETVVMDLSAQGYQEQRSLYGASQAVIVPLRIGERFIGTLGMNPHEHLALSERELALARGVGQMAALVVERDRLLREREAARGRALALEETTRRMDEFMGIASHELRTPLTSLTANIQFAERQLRMLSPSNPGAPAGTARKLETAHLLLERTARQLARLDRLVGDLLDASRIHAGKLEMRPEPCDLLDIVRGIVREQRAAWPKRGINLVLPRRVALPIHADSDRIGQVVTNFVTNALKYSRDDRPVVVRVRPQDGVVRVEVCDHGPGLTAEQQVHLFERFYRVPGIEQQSGSGVGLGLGLYICRTIVERHLGALGVESTAGEGSTFWFTLPFETEQLS